MSKVTKISAYLLSTVILLAIIVPLLLAVLLDIPAVQNLVIHKAANVISRKLDTRVSIDRINITSFNRFEISGFYVEDYDGDTLLYASRLTTRMKYFNGGRGLAFGATTLDGGCLMLRQNEEGVMNIKALVDRLKSRNPKPDAVFRMNISSVSIDGFRFGLSRSEPRGREYGVDFTDMRLDDMSLHGGRFTMVRDSITVTDARMSFRERSGFEVEEMTAGRLFIANGVIELDGAHILTASSDVVLPRVSLDGGVWGGYSDFISNVDIVAEIENSRLDFADVAYFAPSLRRWDIVAEELTVRAEGRVDDMRGTVENMRVADTELAAEFSLRGLPDVSATRMQYDIRKLTTNARDIDMLARSIAGRPLPEGVAAVAERAGDIALKGSFDGLLSDFRSHVVLETSVGGADVDLDMRRRSGSRSGFTAEVGTSQFDLGRMLANRRLGRLTASVVLDGELRGDELHASVEGSVPQLEFNGYSYNSLSLKGIVDNKQYRGLISATDPNLSFDFNGVLDFNGEVPVYDFDMMLYRADLHNLRLNRRDSVSLLHAGLSAHFSGSSLDDANGTATIDDLLYINHCDSVSTGRIDLEGRNSDKRKYFGLRSAFADLEFKSRMSYSKVIDYVKDRVVDYLPAFGKELEHAGDSMRRVRTGADSYSLLKVDVKQANNVLGIFIPGLQLAEGSQLSFLLNPDADRVSLSVASDYIEKGNMLLTGLNVNVFNRGDSLSMFARAEDIYAGRMHVPGFSVIGGARDNRINVTSRFVDSTANVSALANVTATMNRAPDNGMPQLLLRVSPSVFISGNRTWNFSSEDILYDTTRISIGGFTVRGKGQLMELRGDISREQGDTLHLDVDNFDLEPFSRLTASMGYSLGGRLDGHADVVGARGGGLFTSNFTIDSLRVNDIPVCPLGFSSVWDLGAQRAALTLTDRSRDRDLVRGFYRPSDKRYRLDIDLPGIDLSLLDPMLKGVIEQSRGRADVEVMVTGAGRNPVMNGSITVPEFSTRVGFTQVEYTLNDVVMEVKGNVLSLAGARVTDPQDGSGKLDFSLDMNNLRNMAYRLRVAPRNMMVLNTTQDDNDLFYGTIFATGTATIRGDNMGVSMDISATTDDDSQFVMPLSGKSSISQADFVVFESSSRPSMDSVNYVTRRKMMFERKMRQKSSGASGNLNLSMEINVRPNTDFQLVIDPTVGDIVRARGAGTIDMTVNPRNNEFQIYGDYVISEGSYLFTLQNIINKKFVIEQGSSIQWTGDPIDALLDISAIYKLKTSLAPLDPTGGENLRRSTPVECIIRLTDRLSHPTINFDVKVPNADAETQNFVQNSLNTQEMMATQFFWLLAFNSFYADNSNMAQNLNIGAMGGSTTGFEFLSNQISNWLSTDNMDIILRYKPKSDISSEELEFGFQRALINDRLFLEIEGNYVGESTTSNRDNNLMGDFRLTYYIDEAGSLKAQVFSQTIDRFDENQGLQESGIGISYREDFNSFKDIVKNIKARFGNREKRKRRAAERRKEAEAKAKRE